MHRCCHLFEVLDEVLETSSTTWRKIEKKPGARDPRLFVTFSFQESSRSGRGDAAHMDQNVQVFEKQISTRTYVKLIVIF
jgi:hypothetical protein